MVKFSKTVLLLALPFTRFPPNQYFPQMVSKRSRQVFFSFILLISRKWYVYEERNTLEKESLSLLTHPLPHFHSWLGASALCPQILGSPLHGTYHNELQLFQSLFSLRKGAFLCLIVFLHQSVSATKATLKIQQRSSIQLHVSLLEKSRMNGSFGELGQ